MLRKEFIKQFKKKEEFKNELLAIKKKNVKLERKILDLEVGIQTIMADLDGKGGTQMNIKFSDPKTRMKILHE